MKRRNATRSALFTSIISLLLCVSMLVGTTFAWFTDSVVSGTNVITAGNLDVELFYSKTKDFSAENKVDGNTLLFTDKNGAEIKHWEPGVIAYSNFQVANVGTLALTYRLHLMFSNMNTVTYEGTTYDLSDVLDVAIVPGGFEGDRAAAKNLDFDYTLDSFYLEGELEGNETTETFGVVVYWAPNANEFDNIFNLNNGRTADDGSKELKVDLGVNLFATQEEYEFDSFDDTYDEAAGKKILEGEEITMSGDEVTESLRNDGTVNIAGGNSVVDGAALVNNGVANLEDVEVDAGNAGNYALITSGSDAETNLDNVDLNTAGGGVAADEGATVNFNSGSIDLNSSSTSGRYLFYAVGEGTTIVINDGDFDFNKTQNQKRAYIYAGTGAKVIVNGGNFGKASTRSGYTAGILGDGEVVIYGGTFKFNPEAWLAPGFKAEKSGDTWTVVPMASDNAGLNDAIANGETEIALGAGEYTLPTTTGDVTISGTKDVVVTIDKPTANNVTLSGVTVQGSGNYTGIQHSQNVVFENCVLKGTQFLYAEKVTIKNCVIDLSDKADYIWTYGAKEVEFIDCTFETMGKAILIYNESAGHSTQVTVKGCTFNASQSAQASGATAAAIEIDSSLSKNGHYTLITEGNTVDSDFSGEWRIKKSAENNTTVNGTVYNAVVIDGTYVVSDDASLEKALKNNNAKEIVVSLQNDVSLKASSTTNLGGVDTENIVINGNGHKLTLTTTYWSFLDMLSNGKLTINDATVTSTQTTGTWNSYDVAFTCNTELNNVTFEKAIALDGANKNFVLNNVTINETHDYYAMWITAEGQNVEINGLTVNSTGRGIKIDEQYVDAPAKVTLKVADATFTTANKAAILVKSVAGADIVLENVNIANVAADSTNPVWVDEDAAAYAGLVSVTGGSVIVEP